MNPCYLFFASFTCPCQKPSQHMVHNRVAKECYFHLSQWQRSSETSIFAYIWPSKSKEITALQQPEHEFSIDIQTDCSLTLFLG